MADAPVRASRVTDVCKAWENGISLHYLKKIVIKLLLKCVYNVVEGRKTCLKQLQ